MFDYSMLPEHMRGGARRYIEDGIRPGSFLEAVLANNFIDIMSHADYLNEPELKAWAHWLYWELPGRGKRSPWGSQENVNSWIKRGGLKGQSALEQANAST